MCPFPPCDVAQAVIRLFVRLRNEEEQKKSPPPDLRPDRFHFFHFVVVDTLSLNAMPLDRATTLREDAEFTFDTIDSDACQVYFIMGTRSRITEFEYRLRGSRYGVN